MPGLAQRNDQSSNTPRNDGFWSKHGDDVGYNQLQKVWSEISPQARQDLLKIDKQTLLEQARKNMYCSRCNGLLLEAFMQIVMYGKSLLEEGGGGQLSFNKPGVSKDQINSESNENLACKDGVQDPSLHPWGGLTTTREGVLTLTDCYLYSKSFKGLQNVFDSARAREREREMHYPDACGGGGRGWISQGMVSYGRGHGTRETCALHTSRLSCDTLVDFWSALGDETRYSILRMKEEDFVERLMYRFESKRFCRDCRRNVVREFKELKELKRTRREPRCTTWFCVADTAFQYEVSNNTIHADWNQTFIDSAGKYHHFEWAVGTGEGKSDILSYKNVGMKRSVQAKGLDLGGLNACYIALRACKLDGHCTELSVKAHALKGEQCVHCRLMVGDGYVTISHGESIRRFFEYAEEAEEEEDDNSMDKDGNELDDECSRPQKHAKSPELAREFLLDAATVIFKEQVEKAFREGTTRQNAHSIFVCLALKLLEERAHVACKETITLEKQMKLIEEEEKEKHEEEERKERKRTKEKEKKLRRKERLRGKDKVNKCSESNQNSILPDFSNEVTSPCITKEVDHSMAEISSGYADPTGTSPASPDLQGVTSGEDENELFTVEDSILSYQDLKLQTKFQLDSSRRRADRNRSTESGSVRYQYESQYCNGDSECSSQEGNEWNRQSRSSATECTSWECGQRYNHKSQSTTNRMASCGCDRDNDFKEKVEPHALTTRFNWEKKSPNKMDSTSELLKPAQRINKLTQNDHTRDNYGRLRSRIPNHGNGFSRELPHIKKVWEPVEPQKRYPRSSSDSDVTLRSYSKVSDKSEGADSGDSNLDKSGCNVSQSEDKSFPVEAKALYNSKKAIDEEDDPRVTRSCKSSGSPDLCGSSCSSFDNCSSCLSEGDSNTASFTSPIQEFSSTSDSEDGGELSEGRETSVCTQIDNSVGYCEVPQVIVQNKETDVAASKIAASDFVSGNLPWKRVTMTSSQESVRETVSPSVEPVQQGLLPQIPNMQNCYPTFQAPPVMGYYHQNQQVAWPTALVNGYLAYAHPNPYLCTSPFGYAMSGDSNYCMPYDAMQHLPSPLLNAVQLPVYQPLLHTGTLSHYQEQKGPLTNPTGVVDHSNEVRQKKAVQTGPSPKKAPTIVCQQKTTDVQTVNTGFSLFKFSGPVPRALSAIKQDTESLDEDLLKDLPSDLSTDHVVGDQASSKKDTTIEEYTLFAASKGIQFSIF